MSGYFDEEFETRYDQLFNMICDCQESGGDPEKDMPDVWREYCDAILIINANIF